VNELINTEKIEIGSRVRKLRELLSLTREQLAFTVGVSSQTLRSIESGKGFTGDYILAISHFFGMELSELVSYKQELPTEIAFRERIKIYHRKHNSSLSEILNSPPTLKAVIEFRLLKTNFLSKHKTVQEISEYIKEEYDLIFPSSIISQALSTAVKNKWLVRKAEGRIYLYKKSKK
jgi:transcriptional regulator with XRE-family HTH domain